MKKSILISEEQSLRLFLKESIETKPTVPFLKQLIKDGLVEPENFHFPKGTKIINDKIAETYVNIPLKNIIGKSSLWKATTMEKQKIKQLFQTIRKRAEENGYYITDYNDYGDILFFVINANYYDEMDDTYHPNLLYHVTTVKNAKEIMKYGMIPTNRCLNRFKKYPDRLYFFSIDDTDQMLSYLEDSCKIPRWNYNAHAAIIEIDATKLPENIKFYNDTDWSDNSEKGFAVWTDSPIPKKAIKDIRIDTVNKK